MNDERICFTTYTYCILHRRTWRLLHDVPTSRTSVHGYLDARLRAPPPLSTRISTCEACLSMHTAHRSLCLACGVGHDDQRLRTKDHNSTKSPKNNLPWFPSVWLSIPSQFHVHYKANSRWYPEPFSFFSLNSEDEKRGPRSRELHSRKSCYGCRSRACCKAMADLNAYYI